MNKALFFNYIIVIGFAIISCNHLEEASNQAEIFVDFDKVVKGIDLCQYLDTSICEMIVLETNEECIIGEISKIFWHNDTLVICDSESKSVFLFNKDGKYLSKICKIGRSRQEYMDASDFSVSDDEVIILDYMKSKIFSYDFSGNFKYSFEIEPGLSIYEFNRQIFVYGAWGFDGNEHNIVYVYNKDGENEMNYFNVTEEGSCNYPCNDHFFTLTSGFAMFNNDNYTMYEYSNGEFTKSFSFNFGERTMPYKYLKKGFEYILRQGYKKDYVSGISQLFESDRYILCNVIFDDDHIMIYDKKSRNVSVSEFASYEGFGIIMGKTLVEGEYIYSYQTGSQINGIRSFVWSKSDRIFKKEEERLKELTQNLTDIDNGVIIRMKLKGYDED